jgi:hypothetical protein
VPYSLLPAIFLRPWEAIGVSRATWYGHGKPTTKPQRETQAQLAARLGASLRTVQRAIAAKPDQQRKSRAIKWRNQRMHELIAQGLSDAEIMATVNRELIERAESGEEPFQPM